MSKGRLLLHGAVLCAFLGLGYVLGSAVSDVGIGLAVGLASWLAFFAFENLLKRLAPPKVLGGCLGILLFAIIADKAGFWLDLQGLHLPLVLLYFLVLCAIGAVAGAHASSSFRFASDKRGEGTGRPLIIDTCALIDGRIADLVALRFVTGPIILPRFVLAETQSVADSPDHLRRARGRRGLSTAERLQGAHGSSVSVSEEDYPAEREVDAKLVRLAKARGGSLVTTDYNLAKVAGVEGVEVLNVHELSLAMRPIALTGETVKVVLQKMGKEAGQGVGYLDDGTMVVVDNGANLLERQVEAVVSSTLQTSSGRMIFARLPDGQDSSENEGREGRGRS